MNNQPNQSKATANQAEKPDNQPKVSIITASYNSEKTIRDTFYSVLSQTYGNIEHIIVDGGSTDKTMDIVREFEGSYGGRLRRISEKDRGIYDALNKGISMATGDIVGLLHSDDLLGGKDVIAKIAGRFTTESCEGVYGDLVYVEADDVRKVKRIWIAGKGKYELGWIIPHQTLYLKKEIYDKFGGYLADMTNAADNEFILRVCRDGKIKLSYINDVLVIMKLGGASTKNIRSNQKGFREVQISYKMHGIKFPYLINTLRLLSKIKQVIRAKVSDYKVDI